MARRNAVKPVVVAFAAAMLSAGSLCGEVRLVGSDLLGEQFRAAVAQFAAQRATEIRLELRGSRPGLAALGAGAADVGFFFLPAGETPPPEFVTRVIGSQPVVVLVSDQLPVTQITLEQLRGIYGADAPQRLVRWEELGVFGGLAGQAVAPRALAAPAGLTLAVFQRLVLRDSAVVPNTTFDASVALLEQRVRDTPGAIGLSPMLPAADAGVHALAVAASPRDPACLPTPENLHDGSYPLRLPLYLVCRREKLTEIRPLLRFLLLDAAALAAWRQGYVQPLPAESRERLALELESAK